MRIAKHHTPPLTIFDPTESALPNALHVEHSLRLLTAGCVALTTQSAKPQAKLLFPCFYLPPPKAYDVLQQ